jgi:putative flippase GtrA
MNKKDIILVTIIGAAVGLLIQPVLINIVSGSPFLQKLVGGTEVTGAWKTGSFFFFFFFAPFALAVAYVMNRLIPVYQFAKFAAVGVLNSFISAGVINLLSIITGITSGPWIPPFATAAFLASTTNSFFWNKFWTFQVGGKIEAGETAKFYTIAAIGAGLNIGTVSVVVNYLRPEAIKPELWLNIGTLCGIGASFLWNFFGYKYVVFKKTTVSVPAR